MLGGKIIRRRGNNGAVGVQGCLGELLDLSNFTTRNLRYYTLLVTYMYLYIYCMRTFARFMLHVYSYIYIYGCIYILYICICIYICASGGEGCLGELLDFSHFTTRNPRYDTFTRYIHTHAHTHTHTYVYTYIRRVCVCVCVCVCARVYMLSCVYICSVLPEVF
jgi:hypothetical protein